MEGNIDERLKLLASSQESMTKIADIIEQWEKSQAALEKCTFDSMNISDTALNLSKEGNRQILKLMDNRRMLEEQSDSEAAEAMNNLLTEAGSLFHNILETARTASEIAHNLEQKVAYQREITEHLKDSVDVIEKSLNQTVACADFLYAQL